MGLAIEMPSCRLFLFYLLYTLTGQKKCHFFNSILQRMAMFLYGVDCARWSLFLLVQKQTVSATDLLFNCVFTVKADVIQVFLWSLSHSDPDVLIFLMESFLQNIRSGLQNFANSSTRRHVFTLLLSKPYRQPRKFQKTY